MGEVISVSYSRIKLWRKCQYAHYLRYVKKIKKKTKYIPFYVGGLFHQLMETYWRGEDYNLKVSNLWEDQKKLLPAERDLYRPELEKVLFLADQYIRHYGKERIKISLIEKKYEIDLIPGKVKLVAVIDAIVKTLQGTWLLERKTAKRLVHNVDDLKIDPQPYIYAHMVDFELDGVIWDFVKTELPKTKKPKPDELFKRHTLSISPSAIKYHLRNLSNISMEIYNNPEAKNPWMDKFSCPRCDYFKICQSEALGTDTQFIIRSEYEDKDA